MLLCKHTVIAAALAGATTTPAWTQTETRAADLSSEHSLEQTSEEGAPGELAAQRLAARLRVDPAELHRLSCARLRLGDGAQEAFAFKFADNAGAVHGIALNAAGEEFDLRAALEREIDEQRERAGPLDARLAAMLAQAEPTAQLPVVLWLSASSSRSLARPSPDEARSSLLAAGGASALRANVDAERAARSEASCRDVLERLRALGASARRDELAPMVFARLTPAQVREAASWPGVVSIAYDHVQFSELDSARGTIRADIVHARGVKGAGVKLAQIEVGGRVRSSQTNPALSAVVQDPVFVCSGPDIHATAVAGVIASRKASHRGIAPDASVWAGGSCGGATSELLDRSSAAQTWGARALNLSWGEDTDLALSVTDRYYDDAVLNGWRTVVKSAGNRGALDGDVTSPGLAYNVLTVGSFNDRGNSSWLWKFLTPPDAMSSFSSWRDPLSAVGDRKKPELVAPGENITVPMAKFAFFWIHSAFSGTSMAAPMATGAAGLLMDRDPALEIWPEGVKAILLASAAHNLEGGPLHSEYDGDGGLVLHLADDIARGANGGWNGMAYDCSMPLDHDAASMPLVAGQTVRVAIVWNNDPDYVNYASEPCADIDLTILGPSGAYLTGYGSYDDTYESVQFTATTTGVHTLRLHKFRCSLTPQYLAWAWCVL
jgi:hypothetical protein